MKKTKKLLVVMAVLILCLMMVVPASAAIKISEKSITLIKGQRKTLRITGTSSKVNWSSNKKAVATVTPNGEVTVKKKGTAIITAKVGKKKYTCKVKVESPKLSKTSLTLAQGKTATLKLSGTTQKITWVSSNTKIATVTSTGVVKGVQAGNCTITATVGGKKYTCAVTVQGKVENTQGESYTITYQYFNVFEEYDSTRYQAIIEIKNTSSVNLYLGDATFDIYDSKGKIVTSEKYISATPSIIAPGETGYYYNNTGSLDVPLGQYSLKPTINVEKAQNTLKRYPISNTTLKKSKYGNSPCITGTITNDSAEDENVLWIAFVLYDSDKHPIGLYGTNILNLKAGATMGFEGNGMLLPGYITLDRVALYKVFAEPYKNHFQY